MACSRARVSIAGVGGTVLSVAVDAGQVGFQQQLAVPVDPEAVAVAVGIAWHDGNNPRHVAGNAVIAENLQAIILRQCIQVPGHRVEPLRLTTLPHHHGPAVGHDAGYRLVVAKHLAGTARQRNQALFLHTAIDLVDDAHGLEPAVVQVDEGSVVVQRPDGGRHILKPAACLLLGARWTGCQHQQHDHPLHGISP